jgi:preprotein translocase subunit YajC
MVSAVSILTETAVIPTLPALITVMLIVYVLYKQQQQQQQSRMMVLAKGVADMRT